MADQHWLFGYGSIIWKTGFDFEERVTGYIEGYTRRFWQASVDHRGTPEQPGRVVTLVPDPLEQCWGIAYRLPASQIEQILDDLDVREVGGYERLAVDIRFADGSIVKGLTYNAPAHNPHYLGDHEPAVIARQIVSSTGPSGTNSEYILRLHDALEREGIVDQHVRELATLVQANCQETA